MRCSSSVSLLNCARPVPSAMAMGTGLVPCGTTSPQGGSAFSKSVGLTNLPALDCHPSGKVVLSRVRSEALCAPG